MSHEIRENAAPYAATAFGWWRPDVPPELSYRYWRDVHGPLAARIPGLFQYRQRHLGPIESGHGRRSKVWAWSSHTTCNPTAPPSCCS
jgi:hypothetical protein